MEKISKATLLASILTSLKENQSVPSGTIYAACMNRTTLEDYGSVIDTLKTLEAIKESCHVISITSKGIEIAKQFELLAAADRRVRNV